ncbi:MarR family transcriptional regulator [Hamadaea sp. NPDC051192]|uniref:MarR family winged helix-turn-helix transcriptional regulator n=1 Tax=Hamadaea sp. NPDC051192 TaxID=3154940 RepID=UPI0034123C8F
MTVTREVVQLMAEIAARFNAGYEDAAGTHQLTAMQAKLLMLVAAEPQPMRRLADEFHCDPSNVTGIADRLERRGLVVREPDPGDRRVKNVALTDAGRHVVDDLRGSLGFAAEPLRSLTEPEREQLRDLLRKMLEPR